MQFKRKYYLMLLLLSVFITMVFQGDSVFLTLEKNNELSRMDDKNNIVFNAALPENSTYWYKEEHKTEDTFITESKSWIIKKETILGY